MTKFLLIAIMAFSPLFAWAQKSKYFFNSIDATYAGSMAYDAAGDIWLGCMYRDDVQLIKMNKFGEKLDEVRVEIDGGQNFLAQIIVDSDGFIVGCGNYQDDFYGSAFVFKYDPSTRQTIWTKRIANELVQLSSIVEDKQNEEYIVTANILLTQSTSFLVFKKANGTLVADKSKEFGVGFTKSVAATVQHKGAIYMVGSDSDPLGVSTYVRSSLAKYDPTTASFDWIRLAPENYDATSPKGDYLGRSIIVDKDSIVMLAMGTSDTSATISQIYLQKFDLNGNISWAKRYSFKNIPARIAEEVVAVSDGYIVYGRMGNGTSVNRFAFKTDRDGNLKWGRKIGKSWVDKIVSLNDKNGEMLVANDGIFFLTGAEEQNSEKFAYFYKMSLNGKIEGCDFISELEVLVSDVPNLKSEPITYVQSPNLLLANNVNTGKFENSPLQFEVRCSVPDACSLADLNLKLDSISCISGSQRAYFTVCNIGQDIFKADVKLSIFDKNPTLEAAGQVVSVNLNANGLKIGECTSLSIDFASFSGTNNLFAVAGTSGTVATPFLLSNFPQVTGAAECSYDNNLTILRVPLPGKPNLGPDLSICPNKSAVLDPIIAGTYLWNTGATTQAITVTSAGLYWVQVTNGCGQITRDSMQLSVLPTPTRTVNITFVKGSSVTIGGNTYTQAGTFTLNVPSTNGGCDSLITYVLQTTNSVVSIQCPKDQVVSLPSGSVSAKVVYDAPTGSTTCPDKTLTYKRLQGPASNGDFLPGVTKVCFEAADACGSTASCCFNVEVQEANACESKTNGCVKFEAFSIKRDAAGNKRYRFRITNNCTSEMSWVAFQLQSGLPAENPATSAVITSGNGRKYEVRNPNTNPFYSIRFKSVADGIAAGKSDLFEYVVSPQSNQAFILTQVRLINGDTYQAHLSMTGCPTEAGKPAVNQSFGFQSTDATASEAEIFPNPAQSELQVLLPQDWLAQSTQLEVANMQGQVLQRSESPAGLPLVTLPLDAVMANGTYFLRLRLSDGRQQTLRFVVVK